jgi:DNA-binding NarL/FixJ family response regulator
VEALERLTTRPRVLIADDHRTMVELLRSLLGNRCEVVGAVGDGRQLLIEAPKLNPDVIVLDISMPLLDGFDAAQQLRSLVPGAKFVFLTMNHDSSLVDAAFEQGAVGFVLKSAAARELLPAIFDVLEGKAYVSARLRTKN